MCDQLEGGDRRAEGEGEGEGRSLVVADNDVGARVGCPPPDVGVQADVFGNILGGWVVLVAVASKLSLLYAEIV
jgi:hypothetical protein